MKCFKCGKETDREDEKLTIKGIAVDVTIEDSQKTEANIAYNNDQLGKYSNGKGECHVAICYECYIDGLFNLEFVKVKEVFKRPFPPKRNVRR